MNEIYKYKKNQPVVWFNKSLSKSNQHCPYCWRFVGEGSTIESNKEHLIGREFVPTGAFGNGDRFNFIFRACKECNEEKSIAERHISSVTLLNTPERASSQALNDLAQRKAEKDCHPAKKGTLIKDAGDDFKLSAKFGSANLSLTMSSPPKAVQRHIELLALRHIQGIYSLIASQDPTTIDGTSVLDSSYFHLYESYVHLDWCNPRLLEIMKRVQEIPCYANVTTANGFFKAIMRRKKDDSGEWWFWALEWNKSLRVIGTIAFPENPSDIFVNLPELEWKPLGTRNNGARTLSCREYRPLTPEIDMLFAARVQREEIL